MHLHPYRHLYLYTKGHYKQDDVIEDLKKILGKIMGINATLIRTKDIVRVLATITYPDISKSESSFLNFISHLNSSQTDVEFSLISYFFSILSMTLVRETMPDGSVKVLDLGEPDFDILPAPDHHKARAESKKINKKVKI